MELRVRILSPIPRTAVHAEISAHLESVKMEHARLPVVKVQPVTQALSLAATITLASALLIATAVDFAARALSAQI